MDSDPHKAVLKPRNPGEDLKVRTTVLKRRDDNRQYRQDNAAKIAKLKAKKPSWKKRIQSKIIPATKLVKKALVKRKDASRLKRNEKRAKNAALAVEQGRAQKKLKKLELAEKEHRKTVLIVVRNRRQFSGNKQVLRALGELGLRKTNALLFLPHTEENLKKLRVVEPFAWWGAPSFRIVHDLLHKKAQFHVGDKSLHATVKGSSAQAAAGKGLSEQNTVILNSNQLVEKHLGQYGLLCVEDLVDTIFYGKDLEKFEKIKERLCGIDLGDFTQRKADGFKVDLKTHISGNLQGKNLNNIIKEVL